MSITIDAARCIRMAGINVVGGKVSRVDVAKATEVLASRKMVLWHGGNLEASEDSLNHRKGRWEYGPGLYLITTYDVAQKYAKGSRKLYKVTISEGTDISEVSIPAEAVSEFLDKFCIKSKLKDVKARLEKYSSPAGVPAEIIMNVMINEAAVKSINTADLRDLVVKHGADYQVVEHAFGYDGVMVVLYNMKKIMNVERMSGKKIEVFDLPTVFS